MNKILKQSKKIINMDFNDYKEMENKINKLELLLKSFKNANELLGEKLNNSDKYIFVKSFYPCEEENDYNNSYLQAESIKAKELEENLISNRKEQYNKLWNLYYPLINKNRYKNWIILFLLSLLSFVFFS